MNKNAIKKYAVWARQELIDRVSKKALRYGISPEGKADPKADSIDGRLLSEVEKKQRTALIQKVSVSGYEQTMEEAAYTWFNRFAALRFMEVNGYLPSHVRVFTNDEGEFKPQILAEAIRLDLPGLDMEKVYAFKDGNKTEELFKYLLIVQCNALYDILPGMFQRIADYTELLLPDNLLREGSVIGRMIADIDEDDWCDQVQIIGWLYQYYNAEKKDAVFAALKKNVKITKDNIPAATQLFTPDWIVRYMVENSLGRLWLEGHPNEKLQAEWKYYLPEAEQEESVKVELDKLRKDRQSLNPEEIRCIDPCMGSGHILAYLFDVLMQIYGDYGYTTSEAVQSIVEKNLYGLDIDDRAAQLAYFTVMMKARSYDRRFFSRHIQPNVMAIQESNWLGGSYPLDMGDFLQSKEHQDTLNYLLEAFVDAKEYGSILQLEDRDYVGLLKTWETMADATAGNVNMLLWFEEVKHKVLKLIQQAILLTQKYDVVVTNPPYMNPSNAKEKLAKYAKNEYPDSKGDLFAIFIEKCLQSTSEQGYTAVVTMQSWMFLSSYEKLREKLLKKQIDSLIQIGYNSFPELNSKVVQADAVVLCNHPAIKKGIYLDLTRKYPQSYDKEKAFFQEKACGYYIAQQENFAKIPGMPIIYWMSKQMLALFDGKRLSSSYELSNGICPGDSNLFIKAWYELNVTSINKDWYFLSKGGDYRKWFGNLDYVINYKDNGDVISQHHATILRSPEYFFRSGIVWTRITSSISSFRWLPKGNLVSDAGPIIYANTPALLSFLNSKVGTSVIKMLSPTLNLQVGTIKKLPIPAVSETESITSENISLSKADWDSFETSWDFKRHPLV